MSHSGYEHPAKAMNRLAVLEGNWEGQGWYQAGPDAKRRHFTRTQNIQRKLDGQLLIIEGRGHAADGPKRLGPPPWKCTYARPPDPAADDGAGTA